MSTRSSRQRWRTTTKSRQAVLAGVGMLAMLVLVPAVPASASPYPPSVCTAISVSTTVPFPGQQILINGSGFAPHQTVTLVLHSPTVTLAQTTASGSGSFSIRVTIPVSPTGPRLLTAIGVPGSCPAISVQLVVRPRGTGGTTAPPVPSGSPSITGANIAMGLGIALALIAGGLLLIRSGRTRSRQQEVQ